MEDRHNILVSAYACSPFKGSEPGVGWGFVLALSKQYNLWVIVEEEKFRADIECWQKANPVEASNINFHFLRKRRNRWLRRIWPPSYYWYYRQWHREALALATSLNDQIGFDLVHQLTMVGYREPGYLWRMGLPFVWGPIGGMGYFPWRFLKSVGVYGGAYYIAYNLYNWVQMRWLRRPKQAAQKAGVGLITATKENSLAAHLYWNSTNSTVLSEVGLPRAIAVSPTQRATNNPLQIVWSGQHTPGKALNLGLRALALLPRDLNWKLHILGSGKCTPRWQKMARDLGIEDRCNFHGQILREDALDVMQGSHAMLITSLRDLTSTVTIEALALGLPIICPDHCGFTDVITDSCGIRVPLMTPRKHIKGLSNAICRLGNDEELRMKLAYGALLRSKDFSWDRKAKFMEHIYRAKIKPSIRGGES